MRRLAAAALLAVAPWPQAGAEPQRSAPHEVMVPGGFKSFTGRVVEKLDVAQYSYVRLATASGEIWAAVSRTDRHVGEEVTLANAYAMEGFESRELGRKFGVVWFGSLAGPGASDAARLAAQHRDVAKGPEVELAKIARAPGADGRTVEEVWAQRRSLAGRPVAVRGKVVKATAAMGRNFLHLRDGTGSASGGTNDVSVTTADEVAVGAVVHVRGKVAVDKDFGSGYTYRLLIEDAKITR